MIGATIAPPAPPSTAPAASAPATSATVATGTPTLHPTAPPPPETPDRLQDRKERRKGQEHEASDTEEDSLELDGSAAELVKALRERYGKEDGETKDGEEEEAPRDSSAFLAQSLAQDSTTAPTAGALRMKAAKALSSYKNTNSLNAPNIAQNRKVGP